MFNTDSYGNIYFPAGVSVGNYPIITTTPTHVLVAGLGGLVSKVSVSQLVSNTAVVNSVFGRQGDIIALPGDYTSDMVKEVGNLYFTNSRSRASISITTTGSTGPATYDPITGVLNIPQYQNELNGVTSFNSRTGAVVLTALDVTTALTYTPIAIETDPIWAAEKSLYYTKVESDSIFALAGHTHSTSEISEGTNLYYTDGRVGAYLIANNYATQSYVSTQIANLVDSAPTTLDTLNELAAALGDDPNFATTVTNNISTRVPQTRTITINGVSFDLSADRSWTITSGVSSVTASSPLASSGGATPNITISQSSGSTNGFLSSTDWNTFNNKANANGSNASGTWGINITGSAGSAGSASTASLVNGTSGGAIQSWDIRTISPSSMTAYRLGFGFTSWANNNSAPYADYLHLRSYSDGSGGSDNLVMFLKSGIGMRIYQQTFGSSTAYSSFKDVAWTDGTNSSGTWGINITGTSGNTNSISSATGASYTWTGAQYFQSNLGGYSGSLSSPPLQAYATGGNSAFMSFHRSGNYAVNMGLDADNVLRIGGWSASANRWQLDMSGNVYVAGSSRAPIFYDIDNTAYYINAASTSMLNVLAFGTSTNNGRFDGEGTWGVRFRTDSGYIWFGPANTGHAHIYTDRPNFYLNAPLTVNGSSIINTSDIRSSIFYDVDNTAYYTDPNGISSVYGVAIRGDQSSVDTSNQIFFWGGGNTTTSAIGFKANGGYFTNPTGAGDGYNTYFTMDSVGRGWVFRRGVGGSDFGSAYTSGWILNNGVWQANDSMRAPVFYDSNDTGYYIDPASTTRLNDILGGGASSKATSWHKVSIETGGFVAKSGTRGVGVYADGSNTNVFAYDYGIGSYQHLYLEGSFVSSMNSHRAPIFYDSNDTGYYIDPNSTANDALRMRGGALFGPNTTWGAYLAVGTNGRWSGSYASVAATDGNLHLDAKDGNNIYLAWYNSSDVIVGGGIQATIYYDRSNTAYYVDPASTSLMNEINLAGAINYTGSVAVDSGFGIYFSANRDTAYGIFREGGGWAHPFPDLRIAFHTGIKLGANASYNGIRFYNDYTMVAQVMSVNNGSDPLGANNVYVNNNLMAGVSLRAPICYDSDNTNYYIDAAITSNLNAIVVGTLISNVGWLEVRSNVAYTNPTTDSGLFFGWNKSGGNGEANIIVDGGANTGQFLFQRYNGGGSYTNIFQADIYGITATSGTVNVFSDIRLKTNITNASPKLNDLMKLNVVNYEFVGEYSILGKQLGFIAQEVEQIFPSLVTQQDTRQYDEQGNYIKGYEDTKVLKVGMEFAMLVKAIQEQQSVIELLKLEIETLKQK